MTALALLLGTLLSPAAVRAGTSIRTNIFLDAAQLDSLASFPSDRVRTLQGGEIRFEAGGPHNGAIMRIPLAGLIPFSATNVGRLTVTMDFQGTSANNDAFLVLGNLDRFEGFQRGNSEGGYLWAIHGTYNGTASSNVVSSGVSGESVREQLGSPAGWRTEFLVFPYRANWLEIGGWRGILGGHFVPATPLAQAGPFELLLFGNGVDETYSLRSVQIEYSSASPIADSELDFIADRAAGQGWNQWSYGYYDASADSPRVYHPVADFQLMEARSSLRGEWFVDGGSVPGAGGAYWTSIRRRDVIPNQYTLGGMARPDEHWVIRRWTPTNSASYLIAGAVAKRADTSAGDGVRAMVMVAGFPVWERSLEATDTWGTTFHLELGLSAGTPVDFVVAPNGTISGDWTDFTVAIGEFELASPIPYGYVGIRPAYEIVLPTQSGTNFFYSIRSASAVPYSLAPDVQDTPFRPGTGVEMREFFPAHKPAMYFESIER